MLKILLTGSSIFEQWGQADGLARDCEIINRAVGGTITSYWLENFPAALTEARPDVVAFYCGSNDLNAEVPSAEIISNTQQCRRIVKTICPDAKFAYFSIIKAPQKADKFYLIDQINATVKSQLLTDDLYVESNEVFCPGGKPVNHFYIEDQLHLTAEAYKALAAYSQPLLQNWLTCE